MHYEPDGTSLDKTVTPQKSLLLEKVFAMIEMKRKAFLNGHQKQRLELQHVHTENARRLSDLNGTTPNRTILPPLCNRHEEEPVHISESGPPNCGHHQRSSFSKSNTLNQALLLDRTRGGIKDECEVVRASSGLGLFKRPSDIACSERKKDISKCPNCGTSDRRESKVALTKYQLKKIFIPIDEDKKLQENRQKMDQIQEMKDRLDQKKQFLDKKIQSWYRDLN